MGLVSLLPVIGEIDRAIHLLSNSLVINMPLPSSDVKQHLSFAYIRAVAAQAGFKPVFDEHPEYGMDGRIMNVTLLPNGKYGPSGVHFEFQAKASTRCILRDDTIAYDLDAKAYNNMASWDGALPCFIVLMSLPKNAEDWLSLSEEKLLLKNCCYWMHITGPVTSNKSKKRIYIPRSQLFEPEAVQELIYRIRAGEFK